MTGNTMKKSRFQSQDTSPGDQKTGRFGNETGSKAVTQYTGKTLETRKKDASNYALFIVGFVFLILPLIVRGKAYDPKLSEFDWFADITEWIDIFLYYKQFLFNGILFIMLICMAWRLYDGKKKFYFEPIFIPLAVYLVTCVLSTVVSKYRNYGLDGGYEQFENVFCLAGYAVIVYFVYLYVCTEKDVRTLINTLAIGALIIGVIGTFQGLKLDFFRTDFGKSFFASPDLSTEGLEFSFPLGRAYVTLYNPNYVGVYCTLLIPMFAVLAIYAKKIWERILYIAVVLTLLMSMFAAQFKAGIVSLAVVGLIMIVLLRKKIMKMWYIALPVIIGVVALFVVVDSVNEHNYSNSIMAALKIEKTPQKALSELETEKDRIKMVYNGQTYYISNQAVTREDGSVTYTNYKVTKEDGTELPTVIPEGTATVYVQDENVGHIYMYDAPEVYGFAIYIDDKDWRFVLRDEGYKLYNPYAKESDVTTAETAVFDGYEDFASKRGFIWARTLPLLKDNILLGSGAETFVIEFPQHDFVGIYNNGYQAQLITKPHCWYLQVGVQTGCVSLIALIGFYLMYFVQCIRLYSKNIADSYLAQVGVAIFLGTIGYIISGITNDSSITVAPIFWGLMGLGVTVNALVRYEMKTK